VRKRGVYEREIGREINGEIGRGVRVGEKERGGGGRE
jgi:hypothetical protein